MMRVLVALVTASLFVGEKGFARCSGNELSGTVDVDVTGTAASGDETTSAHVSSCVLRMAGNRVTGGQCRDPLTDEADSAVVAGTPVSVRRNCRAPITLMERWRDGSTGSGIMVGTLERDGNALHGIFVAQLETQGSSRSFGSVALVRR